MEKERGYIVTNNKKECTGCKACASACPKNAINMIEDEEGFLYPKIDKSKCINCNICKKICPINKEKENIIEPKAYFYITEKEKDLLEASSGGAFGDIINSFYEEENTIVYGCIFDKNFKAIHIGIEAKEDMYKFKKSKYVQSNLLNTFKEVKENLTKGKKILFSGTPCQISGLKSFLRKEYDNLLCVDIICHGVPSQKLLDYYIATEEKKFGSKLESLNFREKIKQKSGNYNSKNIKLTFKNKSKVIKSIKESSYMYGFQNRLFYRPSCYECNFCKINRTSDITIADCWGFETISNKYDFHKGISCIIINSSKGEKIFNKMNGIKDELPLEFVVNNNSCYTKPTTYNKNRTKFFNNLNVNNFEQKAFKLSHETIIKRIIKKIKYQIKK